MLSSSSLAVFIPFSLALLLTPGPAVLYVVARSVDQGRLAGIVSAAGIAVGTLFHITAAALGVSALLMSSALAFEAVKYLGAAYLIYLGIRKLFFEKDAPVVEGAAVKQPLRKIFLQGIVVNVLNPKTALFFFAFLPQFADPSRGSVALQILLLGTLFMSMAICSDSMYALLSGSLAHFLKGNPAFMRGQRYFSGGIYVALGLTAALTGHRTNK